MLGNMIRLATVVPALNQVELLQASTAQLLGAAGVKEPTELVVLDNRSQPPIHKCDLPPDVKVNIVCLEKNIGVYGSLQAAFGATQAEIVAVFHSDFVIWESEWCYR